MAKKNRGWVRIYRQIQDSAIWSLDGFDRKSAWIDLILMVNHEDRTIIINGKPKVIHAGQHWTSSKALAARWGWSRNRVSRYLRLLKDLGMVTTNGTPSGTLITLVNYEFYQGGGNTNGATPEAPNGATDGAAGGATDGAQTRTKEKLKKNEEENARARGFVPPEGEGWQ